MPPALEFVNLSVAFPAFGGRRLTAVRGLSLAAPKASITCIVGESGCGKSLACRSVPRLAPENAILQGEILFQGENTLAMPARKLRKIRGAKIGMIFQEPMTSLNPAMTVGRQTAEPLRLHLGLGKKEAREKVRDLFAQAGIPAPERRYYDYPHQLSGGMRQRVMIAMAMACGPDLLLADEPTTALDATIQGQILRLVISQCQSGGMACLLITHDLGIVAEVADSVGVMYAGILVERAEATEIFARPLHPYARGLMACAPGRPDPAIRRLPAIPGSVPRLEEMPGGCPFHPRCGQAMPICSESLPPALEESGHMVACWLYCRK